MVGRTSHGAEERRLVRWLLLAPHGIPVRLGHHEPDLDGSRRRPYRR